MPYVKNQDSPKIKSMLHGARQGQIMLISVLALGGAMLGATALAGLMTTLQLQQTRGAADSAKAIYAADAALEWGLYLFFNSSTALTLSPTLGNGATLSVKCYNALGSELMLPATPGPCANETTTLIRATGAFQGTSRAFELRLQ